MEKNVYCVSIEPSLMHMFTTGSYLKQYPKVDRDMSLKKFLEEIPELNSVADALSNDLGMETGKELKYLNDEDIAAICIKVSLDLREQTKFRAIVKQVKNAETNLNRKQTGKSPYANKAQKENDEIDDQTIALKKENIALRQENQTLQKMLDETKIDLKRHIEQSKNYIRELVRKHKARIDALEL